MDGKKEIYRDVRFFHGALQLVTIKINCQQQCYIMFIIVPYLQEKSLFDLPCRSVNYMLMKTFMCEVFADDICMAVI